MMSVSRPALIPREDTNTHWEFCESRLPLNSAAIVSVVWCSHQLINDRYVTAPDGRTKSVQLGGRSPETMGRLLLLELEREKSE